MNALQVVKTPWDAHAADITAKMKAISHKSDLHIYCGPIIFTAGVSSLPQAYHLALQWAGHFTLQRAYRFLNSKSTLYFTREAIITLSISDDLIKAITGQTYIPLKCILCPFERTLCQSLQPFFFIADFL